MDVLYVSPHPDDVAFSAAGRVARDVAAGRRVGVLTLFAPEPGTASQALSDAAARRAIARRIGYARLLVHQARVADAQSVLTGAIAKVPKGTEDVSGATHSGRCLAARPAHRRRIYGAEQAPIAGR